MSELLDEIRYLKQELVEREKEIKYLEHKVADLERQIEHIKFEMRRIK